MLQNHHLSFNPFKKKNILRDIWPNHRAPGCLGCHHWTEQSPWCRCIWVPSVLQGLGSAPGQERDQTHGPPPGINCSLTVKTMETQKALSSFPSQMQQRRFILGYFAAYPLIIQYYAQFIGVPFLATILFTVIETLT